MFCTFSYLVILQVIRWRPTCKQVSVSFKCQSCVSPHVRPHYLNRGKGHSPLFLNSEFVVDRIAPLSHVFIKGLLVAAHRILIFDRNLTQSIPSNIVPHRILQPPRRKLLTVRPLCRDVRFSINFVGTLSLSFACGPSRPSGAPPTIIERRIYIPKIAKNAYFQSFSSVIKDIF